MTDINDHSLPLPCPAAGTLVARSSNAPWQESDDPDFLMKSLYEDLDKGDRTWLMKVEPGAYSPPHAHEGETEQIFVLEGSFHDDENTYHAGDFAVRAAGAIHSAGSKDGALVMLVYSRAE